MAGGLNHVRQAGGGHAGIRALVGIGQGGRVLQTLQNRANNHAVFFIQAIQQGVIPAPIHNGIDDSDQIIPTLLLRHLQHLIQLGFFRRVMANADHLVNQHRMGLEDLLLAIRLVGH